MRTNLVHATRGLLLTFVAGCGLISSDITTIRFALPERNYSFDTAKAGWNLPPATLPRIDCTDSAACCEVATMVGIDCARVICDAPSGTCALTVTVETPPQSINLKAEVPMLSAFNKQTAIDVTISQIKYDVTVNTMNVNLPQVELFVAAEGVTSTSGAQRFGTVPLTPAMMTVSDGTVTLDPAGQAAFVGFAHNFGTPFVFLSKTTVIVPGGTPLPMGAVDITIKGQLSAKAAL